LQVRAVAVTPDKLHFVMFLQVRPLIDSRLRPGAAFVVHLVAAFLLRNWISEYGHAYGGFGAGVALIAFVGIIALFWVWIAAVMGVYWEHKAGSDAVAAMEKLSADISAS
jgi:hypothetical protein